MQPPAAAAAAQPAAPSLQQCLEVVKANPGDFDKWAYLLDLVDKEGAIESIRQTYNQFLSQFPLCYFYWKKWADHEIRAQDPNRALEIYEQAVSVIPYSLGLWTFYCSHLMTQNAKDVEKVRGTFQRATELVGANFTAKSLWDKWIEFETSQQDYRQLGIILSRLQAIPLQGLADYHQAWQRHTQSRPLADWLTSEERKKLEEEVGSDEEALQAKILSSREEDYQKANAGLILRQPLEQTVAARLYYHPRDLGSELKDAWRNYLTFEESQDQSDPQQKSRSRLVFERCLIVCCDHLEFWLRYASWLRLNASAADATQLWTRGTSILPRRSKVKLQLALHQEAEGKIDQARLLYTSLMQAGHLEATLRLSAFESRQDKPEAAVQVLSQGLQALASSPQSEQTSSRRALITIALADLHLAQGHQEAATKAYREALKQEPESPALWLAFCSQKRQEVRGGSPEAALEVHEIFLEARQALTLADAVDVARSHLDFAHDSLPVKQIMKLETYWHTQYPDGQHPPTKKRERQTPTTQSALQQTGQPAAKTARTDNPVAAMMNPQQQAYMYGMAPNTAAAYPNPAAAAAYMMGQAVVQQPTGN